jgi:hypothetical protein
MVRDWTAARAVGGRAHRHDVDDATFDRARDYSWGMGNFDNQTDLFIYQLEARCHDQGVDAGPWIASLRDIVRQARESNAERLRSLVAPHLTRTVSTPRGMVQATAHLVIDHGALSLSSLQLGRVHYRQDNRQRHTWTGIEYAD